MDKRKKLPVAPTFEATTLGQHQVKATLDFLKSQLEATATPFAYDVIVVTNGVSQATGKTVTDTFEVLTPTDIKEQVSKATPTATPKDIDFVFEFEKRHSDYEKERKAVNSFNMKLTRNARK